MNTPNIRFYALMVNSTQAGKSTPKYTITAQAGYYPPMEQLRGRDKQISMNLLNQSREDNSSTPPMKLQAKNSLNFTGLKDLWREGVMSGFAYGYPLDKQTYSKDNKINPFYEYKEDGFLFIIHPDDNNPKNLVPVSIEVIVLEGAKVLISQYCKQLEMGGFNDKLKQLRELAQVSI